MSHDDAKWVRRFWYILLVPWVLFAPLAGMAFDSDHGLSTEENIAAWMVVCCIWSYPAVVGISVLLKRKNPGFAFLPALNFFPLVLAVVLEMIGLIR